MNYRDILIATLIFLILPLSDILAQGESISLANPSFEAAIPRASKPPAGWVDCNFFGESAPDVQPGFFEVTTQAQGLSLCRSDTYESMLITGIDDGTDETRTLYKFNTPAVLRIYGGNSYIDKRELLDETDTVANTNWKKFEFKFEPKATYSYIILEAFYKTPVLFPYNGNVLADNASEIVPIPCNEEDIILEPLVDFTNPKGSKTVQNKSYTVFATVENVESKNDIVLTVNRNVVKNFAFNPESGKVSAKVNLLEGRNALKIKVTNASGTTEDLASLTFEPAQIIVSVEPDRIPDEPIPNNYEDVSPIPEPKAIEGVSRQNMKTGQTIKLSRLYFEMDQSFIKDNSYGALNEIYDFLIYNNDIVIEVGGHTNSNCDTEYCDELSEKRAKAVADYLIEKGIADDRVSYKGYGKRNPLESNKSREGRKKNQRVEIKIVSLDG